MLNFKNRANELNNYQAELQNLIDEENKNQWEKRQKIWDQENENRLKLLYETYESRACKVKENN